MQLSGVVIRNENHGRFVPDDDPRARLRLTGTTMHGKEPQKVAGELNLYDLIDHRLSFECHGHDGRWVCGLDKDTLQIVDPQQARPAADALGQRAQY